MLMSIPAVRHARVQSEQERGQKLHNVVIGLKQSISGESDVHEIKQSEQNDL